MLVDVENDAVHFGVAEMLQHLQTLVPSDDHAGAFVPYNWLHVAEFLYAPAQLLKLRITGF